MRVGPRSSFSTSTKISGKHSRAGGVLPAQLYSCLRLNHEPPKLDRTLHTATSPKDAMDFPHVVLARETLDFDAVVSAIGAAAGPASYHGFTQGNEETGMFFFGFRR